MSDRTKSLNAYEIFYCKKCLVSSARPRISFDDKGICNGCNYLDKRKEDDYKKKGEELKSICDSYRSKNGYYDCIVPWSGGKDSSSIAYKLKFEFKMNPLLVTFAPLIPSEVGYKNRENLVRTGFDHEYFRPNQKVSQLLSRRFFIERGDPKIHWNAGIHSTPLRVSIEKKIPLIFYAEHGDSLYGGNPLNADASKLKNLDEIYENLIGDDPRHWIDEEISQNDIFPYTLPDETLLKKNKTTAYFFGYFENWNVHKNFEFLKSKINFFTHPDGRTPGTFTNFDSLDDHIDQVYYYMQYIKFGFGRASRDGSRQLQHGIINKKQFIENVIKYDSEIPSKDIARFCEYINISSTKFSETVDQHRNKEIWKKTANGWDLKNQISNKIINEI